MIYWYRDDWRWVFTYFIILSELGSELQYLYTDNDNFYVETPFRHTYKKLHKQIENMHVISNKKQNTVE